MWSGVAATPFYVERRAHKASLVKSVGEFVSINSGPKMGFEPLIWYCQPASNSIWAKAVDSAFGSYTPCAINTVVISTSNLVLMGLCLYRIWLITSNAKAQRFCLSSNYYNYVLGMLAGYCAVQPLLRLITGTSAFNLNGETGFAPFEVGLSSNMHTLMRSLSSACILYSSVVLRADT